MDDLIDCILNNSKIVSKMGLFFNRTLNIWAYFGSANIRDPKIYLDSAEILEWSHNCWQCLCYAMLDDYPNHQIQKHYFNFSKHFYAGWIIIRNFTRFDCFSKSCSIVEVFVLVSYQPNDAIYIQASSRLM